MTENVQNMHDCMQSVSFQVHMQNISSLRNMQNIQNILRNIQNLTKNKFAYFSYYYMPNTTNMDPTLFVLAYYFSYYSYAFTHRVSFFLHILHIHCHILHIAICQICRMWTLHYFFTYGLAYICQIICKHKIDLQNMSKNMQIICHGEN